MVLSVQKIQLILLKLFILLVPYYFFRSGTPQIADYVMLSLIVITIVSSRSFFSVFKIKAVKFFALFAIYSLIVNLSWILFHGDTSVYIHSIFYIFNVLLFSTLVYLGLKNDITTRIIVKYSGYSILLLTIISIIFLEISGYRQTLFFNNPNQLGYFSLTYGTLYLYGIQFHKINKYFSITVMLAVTYLTVLSLSSAAMLGLFLLYLIYAVLYFRKYSVYVLGIMVLSVAIYNPIKETDLLGPVVRNAEHRITTIGRSSDDNLAGRGYDRIINHPGYLLFGAGEGATSRFDSVLPGELHSSWGVLLFSYGIVGLFLFGLGIYKTNNLRSILFFLPIVFYGITHQGLRATQLWILLALFFLTKENINREKEV